MEIKNLIKKKWIQAPQQELDKTGLCGAGADLKAGVSRRLVAPVQLISSV